MENKNKNAPFNYLPIALLLSLVVVVGVVFSSIRNSGSVNLLAMDEAGAPNTANYNCEDIKAKLDSGGSTAAERGWYAQNCGEHSTAPSYDCAAVSLDIGSGSYTPDEKAWYDENCKQESGSQAQYSCDDLNAVKDTKGLTADEQSFYDKYCKTEDSSTQETSEQGDDKTTLDPCGYLSDLMAKYSGQPDSEQYLSAKKKYDLYCSQQQPGTNVCSDLKLKLETFINNGQTNTDDYLEAKLKYTALCSEATPINDRCAELKDKLETYVQSGDSTSEGYVSAKDEYLQSCQKPLPPAGFDDDVLKNFDQKDCPFKDSNVSELCGKAAMELFRRGVIGGFSDGTFRGNELVNRAQAAKFLLLAKSGVVSDDSGTADFSDVTHGSWYERFVLRASHLGVITGYGDRTFRPANGVNVAEFLKMMTLTFNLETGLPYSYTDVHDSDWFAKYAGIAQKYKLFPDNTGGKLDPAHKMTRCEVAIAIYQYLSNRT